MSNLEVIVYPRQKDLGGFKVKRVLPFANKRSVGPFVFLDHMGPVEFAPNKSMDVRPHPHIGLSTLTYLFEGAITHRDSLGYVQEIQPGDVNWMTAGRGIVHSERTTRQASPHKLNGLQFWVALPKIYEEIEPSFTHCPSHALPLIEGEGSQIKLIAGKAFLRSSPVNTYSPLFFFEVRLSEGKTFSFQPTRDQEAALYLISGKLRIEEKIFEGHILPIWKLGKSIEIKAITAAHFVILGGDLFDEERHIWWNFVSSSKERIEKAKSDWRDGNFASVPGESEFIPLPE